MAYTAHPETTHRISDSGWHVITTLLTVAGVVAAGIGAWIEFGPDGGTLTLFNWTWNVSDLSELWAPFLMIGGGLVATLSMGIESIRDWGAEANPWLVTLELLVAVAGIAAVVVGIVLLF